MRKLYLGIMCGTLAIASLGLSPNAAKAASQIDGGGSFTPLDNPVRVSFGIHASLDRNGDASGELVLVSGGEHTVLEVEDIVFLSDNDAMVLFTDSSTAYLGDPDFFYCFPVNGQFPVPISGHINIR